MNWKFWKKKPKKELQIPQEILDDFNEAERIMKESRGRAKPYRILFDIANKKNTIERGNFEDGKERRIDGRTNQEPYHADSVSQRAAGLPERRSIQTPAYPGDRQEHGSNVGSDAGTKRRFVFRRRA